MKASTSARLSDGDAVMRTTVVLYIVTLYYI